MESPPFPSLAASETLSSDSAKARQHCPSHITTYSWALIVVSSLLRDYAQREVKALDKSGKQRAPQTVPKFAEATSKS
jgi:hypothetical protein